jgi:hypothetical protein
MLKGGGVEGTDIVDILFHVDHSIQLGIRNEELEIFWND